jgi:glycosyltransferase involved in cell wall biosynthesis
MQMQPPWLEARVRVLHAPVNIAGQPYTLVKALRRQGLEAELWVFKERRFVRGYDRSLHLEGHRYGAAKWLVALRAFFQAARRFDLFHYHTSVTMLHPVRWDLPLLKGMGKKVVMQFWGSDLRGKRPEALGYLRYADAVIVGSYHMLDYAPQGACVVLPGLDLAAWPEPRSEGTRSGPVRVLHAPSSREIKGTAQVLAALDRLRERGVPFEPVLVEGLPHAQAVEIYATCDIAIDQLGAGWYGIFALEMMALGRTVLGYVSAGNADRLERERGLRPPLVSVSAETLAGELEALILDPALRRSLGLRGRRYVERLHDIDRSAEEVIQIYQGL